MEKIFGKIIQRLWLLLCVFYCGFTTVSAYDFKKDGIYYNILNNKNVAVVISGSNKYTGSVVIPENVSYNNVTYSVTKIDDRAFYECSGLTSIEIPNSVTSIGEGTFYECSGLTSIEIPNSVTSIGVGAFFACSGLTSIVIGNSVTSISDLTFDGCKSLTSIEIPNSVTSIGLEAFDLCI